MLMPPECQDHTRMINQKVRGKTVTYQIVWSEGISGGGGGGIGGGGGGSREGSVSLSVSLLTN